jgi:hypothetical protein
MFCLGKEYELIKKSDGLIHYRMQTVLNCAAVVKVKRGGRVSAYSSD